MNSKSKPNIILVLLDGARWDRLSNSSQFMDIVNRGTLLNNVTTGAPYTFASINILFTGLYGKENGVNAYYKMFKLKDSVDFLPEILQQNGYFTSCDLISDKVISSRGFDIYQSHDEYKDDLKKRHPDLLRKTFEMAKEKPIFTFLQFSRIHTVTVSEVLKKYEWNNPQFYENKKQNLQVYDQVFLEVSAYAKIIHDELFKIDANLENTILIFFADHGTGVGERFGERNYGVYLYEETIRTFYLFLGRGIKQNKNDSLLSTIDICPTILDLCNIKKKMQGISIAKYLLGDVREPEERKYAYSETGGLQGPHPSPYQPNVFCVKTHSHKLIFHQTPNEWKLFDLIKDPQEQNNLYGGNLTIEHELKQKLLEWINR